MHFCHSQPAPFSGHVFSGNPGKTKLMDARLLHSGMTNHSKYSGFKKHMAANFIISIVDCAEKIRIAPEKCKNGS